MACNTCSCGSTIGNSGAGACPVWKDVVGLIGVETYAEDGTRNGVDLENDTINAAFFTAKINHTDPTKRWYPIAQANGLKSVTQEQPDSVFETFTDGTKNFIRKGVVPFSAQITGKSATPKYAGKLDSWRCAPNGMSVYGIDRDGNLVGSRDGDFLYPIQIDTESWEARFVRATAETTSKVAIMFDFAQSEKDSTLDMIACADLDGVDLLSLRGLLDVCATVTDIETTGFIATLKTEYGSALSPILVQGLVAADFELENQTTSTTITISSVTEADGVYTFVIPAQSAGDVLILTPTKNGYDFTCVVDEPIVVPAS